MPLHAVPPFVGSGMGGEGCLRWMLTVGFVGPIGSPIPSVGSRGVPNIRVVPRYPVITGKLCAGIAIRGWIPRRNKSSQIARIDREKALMLCRSLALMWVLGRRNHTTRGATMKGHYEGKKKKCADDEARCHAGMVEADGSPGHTPD